ncbi:unnamed protein product [Bursaphelenchus xylophilus]|uniref:(pine wood nematode) hypothetical protein n=1 Tax=Bursaphelenchus xylophilus TaxID=6326 RepID=A0A7I8WRF3_BURXY|nr:unnamed protein product [Bursaphelenchus xylophilus]CAG9097610.1 unnamed protein product [Bursaphelenchus xylophilus]
MDRRRRTSATELYLKSLEEAKEFKEKRQLFYNNLRFFYKRKWNANLTVPFINGIPVDLFLLYDTVSNLGGSHRVTSLEKWGEVAKDVLGYGENSAGGDYCAKLLFVRYLSKFEQCELVGDVDDNEPELSSRSRVRGYTSFVSSECPTNTTKRNLVEDDGGYDRIVKGFCSRLPNEIDFCVNLCTILSAPGPHSLQIETFPSIINLLLAHIGIFDETSEYLEAEFKEFEKKLNRDFDRFWASLGIVDPEVLNMLRDPPGKEVTSEDIAVFPALRQVKMGDKEFKIHELRVNQVLNIFRNLSFEDLNRVALATSSVLVRFLTICIASDHYPLRNAALDTLGELANNVNLTESFMESYTYVVLRHIRSFFFADDRFLIVRAAEATGGFCNVMDNEAILCDFFDTDLAERFRDLMTIQDVLISSHILESLYLMSETGKTMCDKICNTPLMLPTLLNFTTVEGNKFTFSNLQGVKVVEYRDESERTQPPMQPYAIRTPIATSAPQTLQTRIVSSVQQIPTTPYRPHIVVNSKGEYPLPLPKTPLTAQLSKPAEMSSELRVEHYSKIWIRQNCQADPNGMVDRGDIYAAYVEHFRNTHKILSCSLLNFCKFIKDIFPAVDIKNNPETRTMCIEGIRFLRKEVRGTNQTNKTTRSLESNENIAPEKVVKKEPSDERCNGVVNNKPLCNGLSEVKKEANGQCNGLITPKTEVVENGNGKVNGIEHKENDGLSEKDSDTHEEELEGPHTSVDHEEIVETSESIEINGKEELLEDLEEDHKDGEMISGENKEAPTENGASKLPDENGTAKPAKEQTVKEHLEQKEILNGLIKKNKRPSDEVLQNGSPTKKQKTLKKKSNGIDSVIEDGTDTPSTSATISPSKMPQFMCEWDVCTRYFHNGQAMIYHVLHEHLEQVEQSLTLCRWPGCERTPRSRWSLITHLQDHHCNDAVLSNAQRKRKEMGEMNYIAQMKKLVETETPATNHAGYSKFAAYDAIRRHAFNFMSKEFTDEPEGPVTKNLRLTSCLILRNMATHSIDCRRKIRRYEGFFSYLAMSRMESSTAVAQLLGALNNVEA